MRKRVICAVVIVVLCLVVAMPVMAGSPKADFSLWHYSGFPPAIKTDDAYYADIFPTASKTTISSSQYMKMWMENVGLPGVQLSRKIDKTTANYYCFTYYSHLSMEGSIKKKGPTGRAELRLCGTQYAGGVPGGNARLVGVWYP